MNVTAPSTGTKTIIPFEDQSILLVDPAYVIPDDDKAGYTLFHTVHNGYGDGSWEVVNKDGRKLGEIWADSGQVGVFLYYEVERLCSCPLLKGSILLLDFTGTVSFSFKEKTFYWNDLVSSLPALSSMSKAGQETAGKSTSQSTTRKAGNSSESFEGHKETVQQV